MTDIDASVKPMWYRLSRRESDYCIECSTDGITFQQMRICYLWEGNEASLVEEAKKTCKDPVMLIEQRLDFSQFVEEGFGTGDCVIIADGTLYIIDYKHGKGVEVSAEGKSADDTVCPG